MKATFALALLLSCSCGLPEGGIGGGDEGEGEGVSAGEGEEEGPGVVPALFEGLNVELTRVGPGGVDLGVVVSGAALVVPTVVQVVFGSVPLQAALGGETGAGTAILTGVLADNAAASARVVLVDAGGRTSGQREVSIGDRPVRALAAPCDDAEVRDICDAGLGCKGTPLACAPAEGPVLTQLSFQPTADGPRLLVRGEDGDDDIVALDLSFKDGDGSDVLVDLDGDDIPESSGFTVVADRVAFAGAFFVEVAMGLGFDDVVKAIDVVARDRHALSSASEEVRFAAAPALPVGAVCDVQGFDVCAAGAVCAPVGTRNLCRLEASVRSQMCSELSGVAVGTDEVRLAGVIAAGSSLFDTPEACVSGAERARPEVVFAIDVTSPLAALTISTDVDGTACDTIVSVFSSCGDEVPLGCSDDANENSLSSTVVLQSVDTGRYIVVVESFDAAGGVFALSVAP